MVTESSTTLSRPDYEISTDPARLDVDLIHRFLSASYWASGRSRDVVEQSIRHSICFGAYVVPAAGQRSARPEQVGFGRVITDRAVFAYMADVFVVPAHRGRGLASFLVQSMLDHPDVAAVKVFLLRTRDAHRLYERFGFGPVPNAGELMGRYR